MRYLIESRHTGYIFGEYQGDTPEAALAAMVQDADGKLETAPTMDDVTIEEVVDADLLESIATAIRAESVRLCIEHLGYAPPVWYYGGPDHNDDRLDADVDGDTVIVTDGNAVKDYTGDMDGVTEFVEEWLEANWERS